MTSVRPQPGQKSSQMALGYLEPRQKGGVLSSIDTRGQKLSLFASSQYA